MRSNSGKRGINTRHIKNQQERFLLTYTCNSRCTSHSTREFFRIRAAPAGRPEQQTGPQVSHHQHTDRQSKQSRLQR
jgi:hypothetical protein